jgi:hypothetical protein
LIGKFQIFLARFSPFSRHPIASGKTIMQTIKISVRLAVRLIARLLDDLERRYPHT